MAVELSRSIILPRLEGESVPSASRVLHRFMVEGQEGLGVEITPASYDGFRRRARADLVRMELASSDPTSRAVQPAITSLLERTHFGTPEAQISLANLITTPGRAEPLPIEVVEGRRPSGQGYPLHVRHQGAHYYGSARDLMSLQHRLFDQNLMDEAAAGVMERVIGPAFSGGRDGRISFEERPKIVMLGATAEYAPTAALIAAGADLLAISRNPGSDRMLALKTAARESSGRLGLPKEGADLLTDPDRIIATIRRFAAGGPVHLGFFAYEGGHGQEALLALSQITIAETLRREGLLASAFAYRSPAMPTQVTGRTAGISIDRSAKGGIGHALLRTLTGGRAFSPNISGDGTGYVTDSAVPEQGSSYHLGQLLIRHYLAGLSTSTRVFAPVAPIALTEAMTSNRMIEQALRGAGRFGVEVFPPEDARDLMALMVFDHLIPTLPGAAAAQLGGGLVHGGVFTLPWALASLLPPAYAVGRWRETWAAEPLRGGRDSQREVTPVNGEFPRLLTHTIRDYGTGPLAAAFAGVGGKAVDRLPPLATDRSLADEVTLLRTSGDKVTLQRDGTGRLVAVSLTKAGRQGVAFRPAPYRHDPDGMEPLEEVVHLGESWGGEHNVVLPLSYDPKTGALRLAGPSRIDTKILNGGPIFLEDLTDTSRQEELFKRLFGIPHYESLTYAVTRLLPRLWTHFAGNPLLGVDPLRTTVRSIEFIRTPPNPFRPAGLIRGALLPSEIVQSDRWELLRASLLAETEGGANPIGRAQIELLVLGNRGEAARRKEEVSQNRSLGASTGGITLPMAALGLPELKLYGAQVGDPHPRHAFQIVAQALGPIFGTTQVEVPLFAIATQTEATLQLRHFGRRLRSLSVTTTRPVLAGGSYNLEVAREGDHWIFQWIDLQTEQVHAEGMFSV